ncbi:TetR/AcrR family transcriptional regulator [Nonomuraea gerenzanensis]|uniref:Transcriptional regulator, TetR family n=1 Tax=Nonomuraea gerenzanensis TaxID=93944 RepID=A0A1M4EEU5_9ACTN|nr:TetR/AcrR family transcriptional regulator [Nonomuraea gerenzanensis]UBU08926.1 TetR/AcrR family transcriptional regulator [Nonomuraea gerenzanensis]SBO97304.1 Transcriptional regulator, TetR family [Nonomuraea gerenzanensis]
MSATRSPRRSEDGRAARARSTKARIIAAATELFTTHGYAATSVTAIAAEAAVGEQTVYYAFGHKRAILSAALDVAVAGDDEPVPTLDRPWARAAIADPDPLAQLRRQVSGAAEILLRAARLLDVVRSAAITDPDLAGVWDTNVRQRLTVQRVFADALAGKTALRAGLTPETAADIALATLSPETYNLLVHGRGWSAEQWRDWALDALTGMLTTLPRPMPPSG